MPSFLPHGLVFSNSDCPCFFQRNGYKEQTKLDKAHLRKTVHREQGRAAAAIRRTRRKSLLQVFPELQGDEQRSGLREEAGLGKKQKEEKMMPMCYAEPGKEQIIRKVGGSTEVRRHLENLGFVAGGTVTVLSVLQGNVIVKVKESRIAIDEEMARKIMV